MKVFALLLLLVLLSEGRVTQDQLLTDQANAVQERIGGYCMEEGTKCLPDTDPYLKWNSCLGCCSCIFWQEPCYGEKDSNGYAKCLKQDYQILQ